MQSLKNVSGKWIQSQRSVKLKWDADGSNDRFIHVFGINNVDGRNTLDVNCLANKDLKYSSGSDMLSILIRIPGEIGCVMKKQFLLFSTHDNNWDRDNIERIINNDLEKEKYISTAIIGNAQVDYYLKTKRQKDLQAVSIVLNSDADISNNILGYTYRCGNKLIRISFPGTISGNMKKSEYGPILIPAGESLSIIQLDQQLSGNIVVKQVKKPFFGG